MTDPNVQPQAAAGAPFTAAQDRQWAMWAHFGGVLGWIPPLIIWLVGKDRGRMTDQEGKESLNFQITMVIAWVAYWIVSAILAFIPIIGWLVSLLLFFALLAAQIVFPILGGVRVNNGGMYRYPLNFRFIK